MKQYAWPPRRGLLIGLGAIGASVLVPWERARADDTPKATPIPAEPHAPNDDSARPQRAVLFEEESADPNGRQFVGSVAWSAAAERAGGPDASSAEMVLRANISIPDRGMTLEWAMRRNPEKLIWASHTIELVFDLPRDYAHGGIQSVPGMLLKNNQHARGEPVVGTPIKVKGGYFVIGLSAVDAERDRNLILLKERSWLDIPIVYSDGRRAILAVDKGPPGERAFAQAFAAWK